MKTFVGLLCVVFSLYSAVPRLIAYQGLLTDSSGNARPDGQYQVVFSLYEDSVGGVTSWTETQAVPVSRGWCAAMLGSVSGLALAFDRPYWLGVTVGTGTELRPRVKLTSSPYAMRAERADTASYAVTANAALSAAVATSANSATSAASASTAENADSAGYADVAGFIDTAEYAKTAGYASQSGAVAASANVSVKSLSADSIVTAQKGMIVRGNRAGQEALVVDQLQGSGDLVNFRKQGAAKVVVDSLGNVGIGTGIPAARLHLHNSIAGGGLYLSRDGLSNQYAQDNSFGSLFEHSSNGGLQVRGVSSSATNHGLVLYGMMGSATPSVSVPAVQIRTGKVTGPGLLSDMTNAETAFQIMGSNVSGSQKYLTILGRGDIGIGTTTPYSLLTLKAKDATPPDDPVLAIERKDNIATPTPGRAGLSIIDHESNYAVHVETQSNKPLFTIAPGGNVGIGDSTPSYKLDVAGQIASNGTVLTSDARFKTDVAPIDSSLSKIEQLTGVSYTWNQSSFPDRNFPSGPQIGFIAQDVEKVIPEVVHTDAEGYKSLEYAKLTAVLVEAVKQQQQQIEAQNRLIAGQQERIEKLEAAVGE